MLTAADIAEKISFVMLSIAFTVALLMGIYLSITGLNKRPGCRFLGLLCILMGVTILHHFCILLGIYEEQPDRLFMPIYYTLWFGPSLFFAVKLRLYPSYQLRWTDLKHAILPAGQLIYFIVLFNMPVDVRQGMGRNFFSPFYGAMEMLLYITTFYAYLYSAYRFVRYRFARLRNAEGELRREIHLLKRFLKVLLILFWINSGYIITDFLAYQILDVNLHKAPGFTRFGDISFALMTIWVAWGGWRIFRK